MATKQTPTLLSRKRLESEGFHVELVEQTVRAGPKVWKRDLFGFGDFIAIKRDCILLVQTTSRSNMAARVKKITDSPLLGRVREAGIQIHVHGWGQRGGETICDVVDLS